MHKDKLIQLVLAILEFPIIILLIRAIYSLIEIINHKIILGNLYQNICLLAAMQISFLIAILLIFLAYILFISLKKNSLYNEKRFMVSINRFILPFAFILSIICYLFIKFVYSIEYILEFELLSILLFSFSIGLFGYNFASFFFLKIWKSTKPNNLWNNKAIERDNSLIVVVYQELKNINDYDVPK